MCAAKWRGFRPGRIGLGSLIHWARETDWTPPRPELDRDSGYVPHVGLDGLHIFDSRIEAPAELAPAEPAASAATATPKTPKTWLDSEFRDIAAELECAGSLDRLLRGGAETLTGVSAELRAAAKRSKIPERLPGEHCRHCKPVWMEGIINPLLQKQMLVPCMRHDCTGCHAYITRVWGAHLFRIWKVTFRAHG